MKCKIKRTTVIFILIAMIFGLLPAVVANTVITLSETEIVSTPAYDYAGSSGNIRQEGENLSFQPGQWVEYDVLAPKDGRYELQMTTASPNNNQISVLVNNQDTFAKTIPPTGSYFTNKTTAIAPIELKAGQNTVRISNLAGPAYFVNIGFEPKGTFTLSETDIVSTPAYNYARSSGNIRQEAENLSFQPGQWVEYDVIAPKDSKYELQITTASPNNNQILVLVNNQDTFEKTISSTGSFFTNKTTAIALIRLKKGQNTVRISNLAGPAYFVNVGFEPKIDFSEVNPVYKNLYVSPTGDDQNTGDADGPFRTIARARDKAAELSGDMTGDIVVNILPGYYELDKTLVFDESDSGRNGFDIVYRGADTLAPPVISGGKRVTGWEKTNDYIWRAPLDKEEIVRNFYVDGQPGIRARSKYSYMNEGEYNDLNDNQYTNDGFFVSAKNFPESLSNPQDIELVWNLSWTAQRTLVDNIKREGDKVYFKMKQPYWYGGRATGVSSTTISTGKRFYIENVRELLDEPGEFYYNRQEGYIYYYPYREQDLTTAETVAGDLEFMFKIAGSSIENKATNLVFDNLDIRYGAWNQASDQGLITAQADELKKNIENVINLIPAQFAVVRASEIQIINSRFSCLGSGAISMVDATTNSRIEGNLIRDISGTGILIGTPDHQEQYRARYNPGNNREMQMCQGIDIKNNVIARVANEYSGSIGILVFYEKDIDITHNSLMDMPYSQMSIGWGWGNYDSETCGDIKITHNYFYDAMNLLFDGAHLYTLGSNKNSIISDNYFKKSGYDKIPRGGIYTDSGSGFFKIENNVFEDVSAMWHVGAYLTHDMSAKDNYINSSTSVTLHDGTVVNERLNETIPSHSVSNTTVIQGDNWPTRAHEIMQNAGVESNYQNLLTLAVRPAWMRSKTRTIPIGVYENPAIHWTEAEDFLPGGQNVGYYKITELPNNNPYRPDGVALLDSPLGEGAAGYVIKTCFNGEWMKYEVDVPEDGVYEFVVKGGHAWPESRTPKAGIRLEVDGRVLIPEVSIPRSNAWELIKSHRLGKVTLTAGRHEVKLQFVNDGFYLDAFRFASESEIAAEDGTVGNDVQYDEGVIVTWDESAVDMNNPILTSTTPTETFDASIDITGTVNKTADIYLNGEKKIARNAAGAFRIAGQSLTTGVNTFTIRAVNKPGKAENESSITILVNAMPPQP